MNRFVIAIVALAVTVALASCGPRYADCAAARSAGAAPLHAGEQGYRAQLDTDGDGTACESA